MDGNAQLLADAPHRIPARVGEMGKRLGHLPEDIDAAMANETARATSPAIVFGSLR